MRHYSARFLGRLLPQASEPDLGGLSLAASAEWNPVRSHAVDIGPQASRLVVGFRATSENSVIQSIKLRSRVESVQSRRRRPRRGRRRDLTADRHRHGGIAPVRPEHARGFPEKTLYGADVAAALDKLRADPAVAFADVDERRYPHALARTILCSCRRRPPAVSGTC